MPQIEIKHEKKESDGSQSGSRVVIKDKTEVGVEPK
jgi:hypothetical protein